MDTLPFGAGKIFKKISKKPLTFVLACYIIKHVPHERTTKTQRNEQVFIRVFVNFDGTKDIEN